MELDTMIPRIIHQTWRDENIPRAWVPYVESWKALHPDWEYRLWTDNANRVLIEEHYPDLLATYDSYSYAIQRADAVRYCLLHRYGGVYVDMDIECLRPLDDLLVGHSFVAVLEPEEQARWLGRPSLVSNAFMASCAGHGFLEAILTALRSDPRRGLTHRDVLEITGPIMMINSLKAYRGDVSILSSRVAFPFPAGSPELNVLQRQRPGYEALKKRSVEKGAYAVHYWANTWMGSLAGALINPDPYAIPGFDFIPGVDSPGHDIANVGRDIKKAAVACSRLREAVAFNTDGFVKGRLLKRWQWTPMGGGAPNEGLYIKKARGIKRLRIRILNALFSPHYRVPRSHRL
jgi:hypothetical protein